MIGADGRLQTSVTHYAYGFAVALAASSRLFVAAQLARAPTFSSRGSPERRAREFLQVHTDTFERLPREVGVPHVYRLTKDAMEAYGYTFKRVSARSQRVEHWLGVADVWLALTLYGGRPEEWVTEWDAQFDIYCRWNKQPYLIEYQRTPITERQWENKWKRRREWYKSQQFPQLKPKVVLVVTTGQQDDTIQAPRGTIVVRRVEDVPRMLLRGSL